MENTEIEIESKETVRTSRRLKRSSKRVKNVSQQQKERCPGCVSKSKVCVEYKPGQGLINHRNGVLALCRWHTKTEDGISPCEHIGRCH